MKELTELEKWALKELGISIEQYEQDANEHDKKSVTKQELTNLNDRTSGMQFIDDFTLEKTATLEDKTVGMQDVDDFTLNLVMTMQAKIDELEARIQTLEGGI